MTDEDRVQRVREALSAQGASSLATEAVLGSYPDESEPRAVAPPLVDEQLFKLREVLAVTETRADDMGDAFPSWDASSALRDAARELVLLVRWIDQHLTAGVALPMEWRHELTSAQDGDFYSGINALWLWCQRALPLGAGDVEDLQGIIRELEEWGNQPLPVDALAERGAAHERELAMRHAFLAGRSRGRYEAVKDYGAEGEWTMDIPRDEDSYIAMARLIGPLQAPVLLSGDDGTAEPTTYEVADGAGRTVRNVVVTSDVVRVEWS